MTSVLSPFGPVEADLERLRQNLTRLVSAKHPILAMAAEHLFSAGGKGSGQPSCSSLPVPPPQMERLPHGIGAWQRLLR
jgi:hypothetical protein